MMLESLLDDPVLSRGFGLLGRFLLGPLMSCVAIGIALTSDRRRALLCRHALDHPPRNTVFLFNTRCRIGGFLERCGLHSLPLLLGLVEGRLTALEPIRTDWSRR